ncbi:MAG: ribonuclease III [Kiritimatiellia bacterium]|nr:ribonuclease III [Kiritimatiellia bacterium]
MKRLEERLGYGFRRPELLELALTHPSYRQECVEVTGDNQRLEFLGDAVFGLLAGEALFLAHGEAQEGALTEMRSRLVSAVSMAGVARALGLGEYLRLGRGEARNRGGMKQNNLCDVLEAVFGAVYLDGGLEAARGLFNRLFPDVGRMAVRGENSNPRGRLQAYARHRFWREPMYRLMGQVGPGHEPLFRTVAWIPGTGFAAEGEGGSKKVSAAVAAANLLRVLPDGAEDC